MLVLKGRGRNNLNRRPRLLARLLRYTKAHIRELCELRRALNISQKTSQFRSVYFAPDPKHVVDCIRFNFPIFSNVLHG